MGRGRPTQSVAINPRPGAVMIATRRCWHEKGAISNDTKEVVSDTVLQNSQGFIVVDTTNDTILSSEDTHAYVSMPFSTEANMEVS